MMTTACFFSPSETDAVVSRLFRQLFHLSNIEFFNSIIGNFISIKWNSFINSKPGLILQATLILQLVVLRDSSTLDTALSEHFVDLFTHKLRDGHRWSKKCFLHDSRKKSSSQKMRCSYILLFHTCMCESGAEKGYLNETISKSMDNELQHETNKHYRVLSNT